MSTSMEQFTFCKEELGLLAAMADMVARLRAEDDEIYREWAVKGVSEADHSSGYKAEKKRLHAMLMSPEGTKIVRAFMGLLYGKTEGGKEIFVPDDYEYAVRYLLSGRGDLLRVYDFLTDDVLSGRVLCSDENVKAHMERHARLHRWESFAFNFDLDRFERVNSIFRRVNPRHEISEEEALEKYCTTDDREANEIVRRLFAGYIVYTFPEEPPTGVSKYRRVYCKAEKRKGKMKMFQWFCGCVDEEGNNYSMEDERADCRAFDSDWKPLLTKKGPCDREEFDDSKAVAALLREWDAGMWRMEVFRPDEEGRIYVNQTGEYEY